MTFELIPCPKPVRTPKRAKCGGPSKRSAKSKGHLFPKLVSMSRRKFCATQRCVATGRKSGELVTHQPWMPVGWKKVCPYVCRVVAAHVEGRGAGGKDENNLVPLDDWIHQYVQHSWGWPEFEKRLRLMPRQELAAIQEQKYVARAAAIAKNL